MIFFIASWNYKQNLFFFFFLHKLEKKLVEETLLSAQQPDYEGQLVILKNTKKTWPDYSTVIKIQIQIKIRMYWYDRQNEIKVTFLAASDLPKIFCFAKFRVKWR